MKGMVQTRTRLVRQVRICFVHLNKTSANYQFEFALGEIRVS